MPIRVLLIAVLLFPITALSDTGDRDELVAMREGEWRAVAWQATTIPPAADD